MPAPTPETPATVTAEFAVMHLYKQTCEQRAEIATLRVELADSAEACRKNADLRADLEKSRAYASELRATLNHETGCLMKERDALRAKLAIVNTDRDNVWLWQGKGNDLDSLSCPVVMSANTLRALRADVTELEKRVADLLSANRSLGDLRAERDDAREALDSFERQAKAEIDATRAARDAFHKQAADYQRQASEANSARHSAYASADAQRKQDAKSIDTLHAEIATLRASLIDYGTELGKAKFKENEQFDRAERAERSRDLALRTANAKIEADAIRIAELRAERDRAREALRGIPRGVPVDNAEISRLRISLADYKSEIEAAALTIAARDKTIAELRNPPRKFVGWRVIARHRSIPNAYATRAKARQVLKRARKSCPPMVALSIVRVTVKA
jgi:chromosome segregation ATPase